MWVKITMTSSLLLLAALVALKRKKRYENQQQQLEKVASKIEFKRKELENAQAKVYYTQEYGLLTDNSE